MRTYLKFIYLIIHLLNNKIFRERKLKLFVAEAHVNRLGPQLGYLFGYQKKKTKTAWKNTFCISYWFNQVKPYFDKRLRTLQPQPFSTIYQQPVTAKRKSSIEFESRNLSNLPTKTTYKKCSFLHFKLEIKSFIFNQAYFWNNTPKAPTT